MGLALPVLTSTSVAPLTGSVDRNALFLRMKGAQYESLPSRGAWIEMLLAPASSAWAVTSLPSRGAWIEIACR